MWKRPMPGCQAAFLPLHSWESCSFHYTLFYALCYTCLLALYALHQGGRPVRVVDIPGHPRLRGKVDGYLSK